MGIYSTSSPTRRYTQSQDRYAYNDEKTLSDDTAASPGNSRAADYTNALGYTGTQANQAYDWGGYAGGAGADIVRKTEQADAAQQRQAAQANYSDADFARQLGMGARGSQADAMGMYRDAANGVGTSVAQAQFAQALQQQQREQASLAASARGGGLQRAAAQRMAMNNAADIGTNSAGAMAQLRAQEIAAARGGYAGVAGQMRQGDVGQQGQDASQAQFQAQMQAQKQAQNDAMTQYYGSQAMDVGKTQMAGQMARQDAIANARAAERDADRIRLGQQAAATDQDNKTASSIMGGTAAVAGGMMTLSDERSKEDIRSATGKIDAFLEALKAADYKYQDPSKPGAAPGRHTSVMAQDLEKSELGRRMVQETPGGKVVDYKEGFATLLAAQASLKDELGELKKALTAKHGGRKAA